MTNEHIDHIDHHGHEPLMGGKPLTFIIDLENEILWIGTGIASAMLFLWVACEIPFAKLQKAQDNQQQESQKISPDVYLQHILGIFLVGAAVIYVGFSLVWGRTFGDCLVEIAGILVYGCFYWFSIRTKDLLWLSVGWALHPMWDVFLHMSEASPGHHIAPQWYVWACVSFDVVVSIYIMARREEWRQNTKTH